MTSEYLHHLSKWFSSPMTDVKHFNRFPVFDNTIDHAVHVRFAAEEKMTKVEVFRNQRAAIRKLIETENRAFQTCVPLAGSGRIFTANGVKDGGLVALGARRQTNEIDHSRLRTQ